MLLYDTITLDDAARVRKTADGYLVAYPRVARTGIQIYAGKEVGRPDLERVRVFRSADEVFSKESLQSYPHRPVTINHPRQPVTSDNWSQVARGQLGEETLRDGECLRVPMALMDARAIKAYDSGKKQLSMGYTCDLKWEAGKTESGEAYDAIQTNIRANHLAVVSSARGGDQLTIGDDEEEIDDYNPYHRSSGPEGGQFTSGPAGEGSGGSGGGRRSKKKGPNGLEVGQEIEPPSGAGVSVPGRGRVPPEKVVITGFSERQGEPIALIEIHYSKKDQQQHQVKPIEQHWIRTSEARVRRRTRDEATVECPKCHEEMPASASKCPSCGYVMKTSKTAGDSKGEVKMKTVMFDGVPIEFADDIQASVASRTLTALETRLKDAEKSKEELAKEAEEYKKKSATDAATAATDLKAKDAAIAALEKKVTDSAVSPQKLDQMVRDRHEVVSKGKAVLGDKLVVDGKTEGDIRKQVVLAHMGDAAKDYGDAEINAAFTVITKDAKPAASSNINDVASAFSGTSYGVDTRDQAYQTLCNDLSNAWKTKAA